MLKLWERMSKSAQPQGRFHNPKVGSSILPPRYHYSLENQLLTTSVKIARMLTCDGNVTASPVTDIFHSKKSPVLSRFQRILETLAACNPTVASREVL